MKRYDRNDPRLKKLEYDALYIINFSSHYKIKACPFCGSYPWTGGITNHIQNQWTIECRKCKYSFWLCSEKNIVGFWNRRRKPKSDVIVSVDEGHATINYNRICETCGNPGTKLCDADIETCLNKECNSHRIKKERLLAFKEKLLADKKG